MDEPVSFRTIIKSSSILVGLFIILLYIIFQARYLIIGPNITLTEVPAFLQNERQIMLGGSAYNISRLWLNDRPIYTDAKGNFKEALVLENGYTIATLRAEDRYGRKTEVSQKFVYTPASFVE
jgi:hypothetical protein